MYKSLKTWALIDTGASSCLIDPSIAELLELAVVEMAATQTIDGRNPARRRFAVCVGLADDPEAAVHERILATEAGVSYMRGAGMILGADWLKGKRFSYDGAKLTFSVEW